MPDVRDDNLPRGAGSAGEVAAVPSASTILLRGRDGTLETLLIERHQRSSFAPGAWVFPGGMVDEGDAEIAAQLSEDMTLTTRKICAIRELFEETGIWIGGPLQNEAAWRRGLLDGSRGFRDLVAMARPAVDRLVWTSRWITPVVAPKRFDTYFFLLHVRADTVAVPQGSEVVDSLWISPEEALERQQRDELPMVFPTIRNLRAISGFRHAATLLASREGVEIRPVQPVLVVKDGTSRLIVPGEDEP